jgi:hypothetical protein
MNMNPETKIGELNIIICILKFRYPITVFFSGAVHKSRRDSEYQKNIPDSTPANEMGWPVLILPEQEIPRETKLSSISTQRVDFSLSRTRDSHWI